MERIKIARTRTNSRIIQRTVALLKKGGIIIYPTETAYAIGGDALNKKAIRKIFFLKNRSSRNPLPVIAGTFKQAQDLVVFNRYSQKLAKKYWPGPLTLVLRKKKKILPLLTAGKNKIAIRVPGLKISREIARRLKRPVISTSANVSGKKECYTIGAVLKQSPRIKNEVDLILDAGRLPRVKPSAIVEVRGNELKILREGPIKLKG